MTGLKRIRATKKRNPENVVGNAEKTAWRAWNRVATVHVLLVPPMSVIISRLWRKLPKKKQENLNIDAI